MQFSYKVSEADYRRAAGIRVKRGFGQKIFTTTMKTIMFWVFILVCLMLLWAVLQKTSQNGSAPPETQSQSSPEPSPSDSSHTSMAQSLVVNVGPFVLIGAIWVFIFFRLGPRRIGRMYRKDPAMQGTYTLDITPTSLSIQSTAGFSTQAGWNLYDYWSESKTTIILVNKSATYFIISTDPLSDPQRAELRGILASALPKK